MGARTGDASIRRCCKGRMGLGFRVQGLGFGVWGLGFRVYRV